MEITKDTSDGYHIFGELYEYRLLYNAALFNSWEHIDSYALAPYVCKSKKHSDGTVPFGDPKWFIVVAQLPTGQISNHYQMEDWDLFQIPEVDLPPEYDGHTPQDVAIRLRKFLESQND
jgi:hypothetical protein